MTNETDGTKRSVSSLGELSRDVAPPRDLWPSIAAQIARREDSVPPVSRRSRLLPSGMQWAALAAVVSALAVGIWLGRSVLPSGGVEPQVAGVINGQPEGAGAPAANGTGANGVAANGTGVNGTGANGAAANGTANPAPNGATSAAPENGTPANGAPANGAQPLTSQQVFAASLVTDPRYTMQRSAMIRELEGQLKTLPPETQQKVAASLTTIRASMKDIQAALGRDPANALLQELLVNSYQDEMRVLTAVNEASTGRGI